MRGPNVFSGYLNRPDATAEAIRDGWFFTGDIGTRAPDGYWRIVGRRSTDLIKTGGYKVGAGEIEVALLEHPAVREAAVTAAPDDDLGERIVAWVVAEGERARREGADRPRGLRARAPQAPARGALPRRAAPQRDGQGRQGSCELRGIDRDHPLRRRDDDRLRRLRRRAAADPRRRRLPASRDRPAHREPRAGARRALHRLSTTTAAAAATAPTRRRGRSSARSRTSPRWSSTPAARRSPTGCPPAAGS